MRLCEDRGETMTKKKKLWIMLPCIAVGLAVLIVVWLMVCGYFWTWGLFSEMANLRYKKLAGNSDAYAVETVEPLTDSPLAGKHVLFLGSSVPYGAASLQTSFAEYLARHNTMTFVKEAVSGTTLVDSGIDSYIARMKRLDGNEAFDFVVCQLSTNDATQKKPLGKIAAEGEAFDTSTVCGAIEYIIQYVRDTWHCPVVFYTNAYYESAEYSAMVDALFSIQEKYGIGVIDLYTDTAFNAISEESRALWMADAIHPTRAGYLQWWTPKMEQELFRLFPKA